jgi:hypothetical protein
MGRAGGWALVAGVAVVGAALAGRASGAEERLGRVHCRTFAQEPEAEVDTRDGGSPLGQWVLAQEDAGWRVEEVELDVVVKSSGALAGFAHVCLVPVR